jgi:ankyrin repeat protein
MKSVILAFVLGVCLTTWRAHVAILLHTLYSKLHNLQQCKAGALNTHPLLLLPLMVDQAVQTEDEENAKDLADVEPLGRETKNQSHETSSDFEELGKELEVIQTEPETLELGDLNVLRDYLYDDNLKAAVSASAIEPVLEDPVLKSFTSVVRQLFGEEVPPICVPTTSADSECNATSDAENDFNKMQKLLSYLTRRYAVSQGDVALIRTHVSQTPYDEYFGLFKLTIDQNQFTAFKTLLDCIPHDHIRLKLPAIFEYTALRGSLTMMTELHELGIEVDGDNNTHPLSSAVAGGSLDAVRLLHEWGANFNERDRSSIVKQYAQTPIIIAAHNQQTKMVKYLIGAGALAREPKAEHDALSIALADGHANMLLCLMRSGITFTRPNSQLKKGLEIAVRHGNTDLAKMLFEAGANPNAKEHTEDWQWSAATGYSHMTAYGTLFQWACILNDENMVRVFLEHGVDFCKPVKSWANWRYNTPIYVAWSLKHFNVVHAILDFHKEEALVHFTCHLVQTGHWGLFKPCSEYESVRKRSSWLLKECFTRLYELSEEGVFPAARGRAYMRIIHRLVQMGARLPADVTWHFPDKLLLWLGYASLDKFLVACAP